MSFSDELKKELVELNIKQGCCKKAFSWGLLLDAEHLPNTEDVAVSFRDPDVAETVRKLFSGVFGKPPVLSETTVIGRTRYVVTQTSHIAAAMLDNWDSGDLDREKWCLCASCAATFLRGALISCATINEPLKESHLEFHIKHVNRAAMMYALLEELGTPPKIAHRKNSQGLYYKRGTVIEDILLQCGAQQSGFAIINEKIEKDIRNAENRATNCETKNINRAVQAAQKHVKAIRFLISQPTIWEALPEELRTTARLRLEYCDDSLQELIRRHDTPISKSGLNHRLERLYQIAQSAQESQLPEE